MNGSAWLASVDVERTRPLDRLSGSPVGRVGVAVCKAPAQVLFQSNLLAGVVVTVGIAIASWVAAVDFLLGALLATLVALAVGADR